MLEKLKNKKLNILIIALAFSFNICFFAPLEFYYSNAFDLWFTIDYILPIIIGLGIIIFLIMLFLEKNDINPSVLENGVMVVTLKGNINKHRNPKLLWSIHFLKLTKIAYPNVIMSVLLVINKKRTSS